MILFSLLRKISIGLIFLLGICSIGHAQWKPVGDFIKTKWAEEISPDEVLPEYPRPQMERPDWLNLNGLWEYAIQPIGTACPTTFEGEILVPFAVESALSGVGRKVGEDHELWYKRKFEVPAVWRGKDILLHFGAVDWRADIFLNGMQIGAHEGGYVPFTLNITPFLQKGEQELIVKVWDPTDRGYQPCGKQTVAQGKITYTSVTGIWQTVWLEPVHTSHIASIRSVSDIDRNYLRLNIAVEQGEGLLVEARLKEQGKEIARAKGYAGFEMQLSVPNPQLWSPEHPFLYDLEIRLMQKNGKVVDFVNSYTAFRKISMRKDDQGIYRMQLNHKDLYHFGPLDQGWWPDGLYTAPTDEALLFDIQKTKEWGFNMIRKHVKVEPARWYYHCDRLGLLVWQDMPSGDVGGYWNKDDRLEPRNAWAPYSYEGGTDRLRSTVSKANYYKEWKEIMDFCYSFPSVVVWVPFNEAWGQFDTEQVAEWTKSQDPSRLVNPASGGNFHYCGDMMDMHHYPNPKRFYLYDAMRVNVLGEYGGIALPVEGHTWWKEKKNWGYIQFTNSDQVTDEYIKYTKELIQLSRQGYSGAVYTQTTDVEGEINGIMTYDRKVIKMDERRLRQANQSVINVLGKPF